MKFTDYKSRTLAPNISLPMPLAKAENGKVVCPHCGDIELGGVMVAGDFLAPNVGLCCVACGQHYARPEQ